MLCPKCTGFWVASGLAAGLLTVPRAMRVACGALTVAALNDALQIAHKHASA